MKALTVPCAESMNAGDWEVTDTILAPPFVFNSRGVLLHRIAGVRKHHYDNLYSHTTIEYACGAICNTTLKRMNLRGLFIPPHGVVLCAKCEVSAIQRGQPSAEELVGRHVCVGGVKAERICGCKG